MRSQLTIWEKIYIQKNKFRSMNFEIPDERDFISKFIKSTPDDNIIDGEFQRKSDSHNRSKEEEFDRVYQRIQLEEQENRRNIVRCRHRRI
ncbi:hypothetical protein L9F63_006531, partial [Diploptera punctata]